MISIAKNVTSIREREAKVHAEPMEEIYYSVTFVPSFPGSGETF